MPWEEGLMSSMYVHKYKIAVIIIADYSYLEMLSHKHWSNSQLDTTSPILTLYLPLPFVAHRIASIQLALVADDIRSNAHPFSILALILVRVSSVAHLALQVAEAHSRPDKRNIAVTKDADVDVVALQLGERPRLRDHVEKLLSVVDACVCKTGREAGVEKSLVSCDIRKLVAVEILEVQPLELFNVLLSLLLSCHCVVLVLYFV